MEADNRICSGAPTVKMPSEDTKPYEQLVRDFLLKPSPEGDALYAVPLQMQDMHKRACKTICASTMIVHMKSRGNSIVLVPTQINVYFI